MLIISEGGCLIEVNTPVIVQRTSGDWSKGIIINKRCNSRVKTLLIFLDGCRVKEVKYWVDGNYIWKILSNEKFKQLYDSLSETINNDLLINKLKNL